MSLNLTKEEWGKLKGRFDSTNYYSFKDLNGSKISLAKPEDEKVAIALQKTNTIECPYERLNPEILNMLFDLNERILHLENSKEEISKIKSEVETLSSS